MRTGLQRPDRITSTRDESTVTVGAPGPLLEIGEPDWLLLSHPLDAADASIADAANAVLVEIIELYSAGEA